jgi:hypothetical protein
VRDAIREHYGAITNPDLESIMEMILKVEDATPGAERSALVMEKGENGRSMIFHTGHFGWEQFVMS